MVYNGPLMVSYKPLMVSYYAGWSRVVMGVVLVMVGAVGAVGMVGRAGGGLLSGC